MVDQQLTATLSLDHVRDTLARNLAAARTVRSWSQDQLGSASGVSRATINQLEAAEGDPRLSTLVNLAAALEISPMFLLLGRDEVRAICEVRDSRVAQQVEAQLSPSDLATMQRLIHSGIAKNRTKAVKLGVDAAAAVTGVSSNALIGAAIGTALIPGIGTAIGAAISMILSRSIANKGLE